LAGSAVVLQRAGRPPLILRTILAALLPQVPERRPGVVERWLAQPVGGVYALTHEDIQLVKDAERILQRRRQRAVREAWF
jgi:hypothetical protein